MKSRREERSKGEKKVKKDGKTTREKREVSVPKVINDYNKWKGTIDVNDMQISFCNTQRKSRKWYMKLFRYSLDVQMRNAYILYKLITGNLQQEQQDFHGQ